MVNLCLTPQQSKSTMPKQYGEEPAQRSESLIKLCLLIKKKEPTSYGYISLCDQKQWGESHLTDHL